MTNFVYYVDLGGNTGIDMFCSEDCLMKVWKLTAEEVGGERISMSEHIENNYSKDERCFSCDKLLLMTPAPADGRAAVTDEFERVSFHAGDAGYAGSPETAQVGTDGSLFF